ncbi:MAG: IS1595 family transposase [Pirellulaceae bacterium]|nr:IS1595 family transposase [Pirellulaceae bacterium]
MRKQIHELTLAQFEKQFPDETACRFYLQENRWPEGVRCPRCDNANVYELSTKAHHWQCAECSESGYRFSVLVGTIFENTNKPLRDWFRVMHLMLSSKKAVSALQIYRLMDFGSYNTALLMCSKIRVALGSAEFKLLVGVVEVDETFVGSRAKNRYKDKRGGPGGTGSAGGTGGTGKAVVACAVQRKGNVIAHVVSNTKVEAPSKFVREAVSDKVSVLCTDVYHAYRRLGSDFPQGVR